MAIPERIALSVSSDWPDLGYIICLPMYVAWVGIGCTQRTVRDQILRRNTDLEQRRSPVNQASGGAVNQCRRNGRYPDFSIFSDSRSSNVLSSWRTQKAEGETLGNGVVEEKVGKLEDERHAAYSRMV